MSSTLVTRVATKHKKRPKLQVEDTTTQSSATHDNSEVARAFSKNALNWDLEDSYESHRAKKRRKTEKPLGESRKLIVKSRDGVLGRSRLPDSDSGEDEGDEEMDDSIDSPPIGEPVEQEIEKPEEQLIAEVREKLAKAAGLIGENPEDNPSLFKEIAQYTTSKSSKVVELCLVTQLAVYKDVIPGYRIRAGRDAEPGVKLSKEVKQRRTYEQTLVKSYQRYIGDLARISKKGRATSASETQISLGRVATLCACDLLKTVPHFNFRGDVLAILVRILRDRHRLDELFGQCRTAIEVLFRDDESGGSSFDAVAQLTKMIKARDFKVDESIVNMFLHLRLLAEFSYKGSADKIDKPEDDEDYKVKRVKQKREFRTKKNRKHLKERKAIEAEMKEADATVGYEEKDRMQSETLKLVFATYFKILKARPPGLMGAVLEGLAKYAHLINQDFFGDLLEALRELVGQVEAEVEIDLEDQDEEEEDRTGGELTPRNVSRESLLCIITAFALLEGQDVAKAASGLHLDLNFFISHLYRSLHLLAIDPDLELNAKTLRLPDPGAPVDAAPTKVNVQTTAALLIRCLASALLNPGSLRAVPPVRLAAFAKQLATASLQLPEKLCVASLGVLNRVVHSHGKKIAGLWNTEERRGDGVFDPWTVNLESSNPFAATVWEGELLKYHFAPSVREAATTLEKRLREIK
ncbi:MAG: hypothetical protein M1814_006752 [Vezdaea aestivalis]|nr:MAG: hypothetical protein M1814_006752 [Vezdaea aestivalis]